MTFFGSPPTKRWTFSSASAACLTASSSVSAGSSSLARSRFLGCNHLCKLHVEPKRHWIKRREPFIACVDLTLEVNKEPLSIVIVTSGLGLGHVQSTGNLVSNDIESPVSLHPRRCKSPLDPHKPSCSIDRIRAGTTPICFPRPSSPPS